MLITITQMAILAYSAYFIGRFICKLFVPWSKTKEKSKRSLEECQREAKTMPYLNGRSVLNAAALVACLIPPFATTLFSIFMGVTCANANNIFIISAQSFIYSTHCLFYVILSYYDFNYHRNVVFADGAATISKVILYGYFIYCLAPMYI